ncbi:GNAT family N-acetyltransferase [Paenibacillus motobuensis]|uniref:GNAT family N-acetyltransferase n=1 Tax=Paenibacillus TaxID=44249 RepID=UPI00203C734F|nr:MULTISPECIES: GNAT family N-acetyltransferase [Paenibacillus]MCM3038692.1 GNAT family N-acetyltransferase [Paenibacillus lutimineralis]MCM3645796.1 GNAT family N-acetyltransferase [Paenibacillus motobuensis]
MDIKLVPITIGEKEALYNFYQFYTYDFSKYTHEELNEHGTYDVNIDCFFEGDPRWNPYFIELSGIRVGFLVVLFENLDTDPDPTHVIYDFMVLPKYRGQGIGRSAAKQAFDLYKANWKVVQMESNSPAISFWRNVIRGYTNNNYYEIYRDDIKKFIQEFSTKE